ncbi:MAG TPA: serine hydrolase domain-containing protein [Dermatophilaceae bacterium]|nr:serine hydrolase domain-containing protein [Dermatophilaceae bacterium]
MSIAAGALPLGQGLVRDLERRVREAQSQWHSPAVSAGLVRDGALVWSTHVGSARLDPGAVPTDDTQYMIGSITKTFTAVLIMALRDAGRLSLDDRLEKYLPQTRHGAITIRQMLAHASGLQREPVGRIWENLDAPDQERLLRELESAEQVLPVHFAFHYSNLAFALLGQVVEQLEARPWGDVVAGRILEPLEMRNTGLVPAEADRALGYQVHPHTGVATVEPLFDLRATTPLGGLWSTVSDLGRYASFVADPIDEVLSPDTLDEMCRPLIMTDVDGWARAYGLGYDLQRIGERVLAGHGGAMPGFLAGLRVRRQDRVGAVVFANCTAGAEPVALAGQLVTAMLDAEPSMVPVWTPSQSRPDFDGILGSWWTEGEEIVFEVRDNVLWSRIPGGLAIADTRFVRVDADRFRADVGRERGELLEVTRGPGGEVRRMHFATYALTRTPTAFANLLD